MWAGSIGIRVVLISLGVVVLGNASKTEASHVCEHRLLNLCGVTVTSFSGCNTRPVYVEILTNKMVFVDDILNAL